MTPEEINQRIAEYFWPGIMSDKDYAKRPTDYYRTNAAMDLLEVLVKRGYNFSLESLVGDYICEIFTADIDNKELAFSDKPTIPAAICHAILGMIERDGR